MDELSDTEFMKSIGWTSGSSPTPTVREREKGGREEIAAAEDREIKKKGKSKNRGTQLTSRLLQHKILICFCF